MAFKKKTDQAEAAEVQPAPAAQTEGSVAAPAPKASLADLQAMMVKVVKDLNEMSLQPHKLHVNQKD